MVSIRGYKLIQSFETRQQAIEFVMRQSVSSCGIVYRDGNTGKRYTRFECSKQEETKLKACSNCKHSYEEPHAYLVFCRHPDLLEDGSLGVSKLKNYVCSKHEFEN